MKMNLNFHTIRNVAVTFVAVAAMCVLTQQASAQSCGYGGGVYGGGYGGGVYSSGYRGSYGSGLSVSIGNSYRAGFGNPGFGYAGYGRGINTGYSAYRPAYQTQYARPRYHDTSHYDYHPGQVIRHGNHLDYVPGHYDLHRTGHFHR